MIHQHDYKQWSAANDNVLTEIVGPNQSQRLVNRNETKWHTGSQIRWH